MIDLNITLFLLRAGLAAVLVMALGTSVSADETEPFETYDELCGYQIVFWPTRHLALSHVTPDQRKVIILDPLLQREEETARRLFLIAHECAHHRMGHSSRASVERRIAREGEVRDQELSADCWAAEILTKAGYGAEIEQIAVQFYRSGASSPGYGYPSGIQRALMIKRCGEEGALSAGRVRQIARNGAILTIFD